MTSESVPRPGPSALTRVGARPALLDYVADVWRRRAFVWAMARFSIEAEHQRSSLGLVWVVLRPLLDGLVYGIVFGLVLPSDSRPPHFVAFLVVGVFVFEFFSQSWTAGGRSITHHASLVRSLAFPRMVLPLAAVTQKLLQFVPTIGIVLVVLVAGGERPRSGWLLLIPLTVLLTAFNTGLALVTARLAVRWRDLTNVLPLLTRFAYYTTGIFYSIDLRFGQRAGHPGHPWVVEVSGWQPLHELLTLARAVVLDGPDYAVRVDFWWRASGWSLGMLAIGVVFFWHAEEAYGRVG